MATLETNSVGEIPIAQRVDEAIARYNVEHTLVRETIHEFPELRFLLGHITNEPQGTDRRPDNVERPVYYLTEGSGMFGLANSHDAMRWRGIFNHVMGTARQVYWLAQRVAGLPSYQIAEFGDRGYDVPTLLRIRPEALRDFMFVSHAGRRQMDEYNWHGLRDRVHPSADSGFNTYRLLKQEGAPPLMLDLMRVEMHAHHLAKAVRGNMLPDMIDNLLTYPDWTFGQSPVTLTERFAGLRKSGRSEPEITNILEQCGAAFERDLIDIVDPDIFVKMTHAGPYTWETKIRNAYCAPSGLAMSKVFPNYQSET